MVSCVRNIRTKNYQNVVIGFQITVKMSGMFFETQCSVIDGVLGVICTGWWSHGERALPQISINQPNSGQR